MYTCAAFGVINDYYYDQKSSIWQKLGFGLILSAGCSYLQALLISLNISVTRCSHLPTFVTDICQRQKVFVVSLSIKIRPGARARAALFGLEYSIVALYRVLAETGS